MQVPSNIVEAVHAATNRVEVAEAQRMRDAEFWGAAVTWHPTTRFKRDLREAQDQRARGAELADEAKRRHGAKAKRALLDMGHKVRYTSEVVAYATAIHFTTNRGD
jgi:hypothetical protein